MTFSKISKLKNFLETAKNYKFRNIPKLCKEASNQKSFENKLQLEFNNIMNDISKTQNNFTENTQK